MYLALALSIAKEIVFPLFQYLEWNILPSPAEAVWYGRPA